MVDGYAMPSEAFCKLWAEVFRNGADKANAATAMLRHERQEQLFGKVGEGLAKRLLHERMLAMACGERRERGEEGIGLRLTVDAREDVGVCKPRLLRKGGG